MNRQRTRSYWVGAALGYAVAVIGFVFVFLIPWLIGVGGFVRWLLR